MAIKKLTALANNASVTFNPATDVFQVDNATLSAADFAVTAPSATTVKFVGGGKTITLKTAIEKLTGTNVTFADGSKLLVGDATTGTANDGANNTLTGTTHDDQLLGLAGIDKLSGGTGNDLLNGGTGADTMTGGKGDDTFIVDNTGDVVVEDSLSGSGHDLIRSAVTYTLGAKVYVEDLTLTGTGNVNGAGNGLANAITGNSGNNALSGAGGADTLAGSGGNDTLTYDSQDHIDGGAGTDTLKVTVATLDLGGKPLASIEVIDLANAHGSLTLDRHDVEAISSTGTLRVMGDSLDSVHADGVWAKGAQSTISGQVYVKYTAGDATLLIDKDIDRSDITLAKASFDLSALDGADGFAVVGGPEDGESGWSVSSAGDVNGDGFGDFVIGSFAGSGVGMAYVVFGNASGFDSSFSLGDLDGLNGFTLIGETGDMAGWSVSAGDFNADGVPDIMVGAFLSDADGENEGISYVVFGNPGTDIELSALDGANGIKIHGTDGVGYAVSAAGDVNGDGVADLLVSSHGEGFAGTVYVVYGNGDLPSLDLSELDGANGFAIAAVQASGRVGESLATGDFNGDGIADLVMGGDTYDLEAVVNVGATYVVFGGGENDAEFDLNELDGHNGLVFFGPASSHSGYSVGAGGDFNGDGIGDLIIGAPGSDSASVNGAAYVVFGTGEAFDSSSFNLTSLDGANGFKINGANGDRTGAGVAFAGDVNGDGFDDLIVGAPYTEVEGAGYGGAAYVIFGRASGLASVMSVSSLNGGNGFALPASEFGYAGHSVSAAGDVNGDGFDDLLVGAYEGGDLYEGKTYVFFGRDFNGVAGTMGTAGEDNLTVAAHGVVHAGASADGIVATGVPDFIDGGAGFDTLNLDAAGASLHLGRVAGIEEVDLSGSHDNRLVLTKADVLNASDTTNTLTVHGDAGHDGVTLVGNWKNVGETSWARGAATVDVQDGLAVSVIPDAPELSALDGANGFRIFGQAAHNDLGYSVSFAGDVNGDGIDDLMVGALGFGSYAGRAYVVFGSVNGFASLLEPSSLDGTSGFHLTGTAATPGDAGWSVSNAGDFNGDGIADFLVGAPFFGYDRDSTYLVYGTDGGFDTDILLSTLDGTDGVRFGADFGQRIGGSVAAAGDVNGDGLDDLIIGAEYANEHSGGAYVVFGSEAFPASSFNLLSLSGAGGYRISSDSASHANAGASLAAGDFNGDGFADLVLGAPMYGEAYGGAAYVVFGKASGFSNVDLSGLNGSTGFQLVGEGSNNYAGGAVAVADFNGDGLDDLIIGATGAAGFEGRVYVLFGTGASHLASASLSGIGGTNGFTITGEGVGDSLGKSVANAGDVNGDGLDDLIIGANSADAGSAYVIFGSASGLGSGFALSSLDGHNGFKLEGETSGDNAGFSVSGGGDLNGDGFDDLLVGAWHADPNGMDSGTAYVVFGGNFSGAVDLMGTGGDDTLIGTAAGNVIFGGQGEDVINGRGGNDTLVGAWGEDTFLFDVAPNSSTNHDVIRDFETGVDQIELDNTVFTAFVSSGAPSESIVQYAVQSAISATSGDGDDRLKFAWDTGKLYYDANGNASGGLVLIAQVMNDGSPAQFSPTQDIIFVGAPA